MLSKPSSCEGCPLYQGGQGGFVPDEVREGTEVFVLRQNPGQHEVEGHRLTGYTNSGRELWEPCLPAPLIWKTGYDVERQYLPKAGLTREEVSVGNIIRCRWHGTDQLPPLGSKKHPDTRQAILHCQAHHFRLPASTRVVLAGGEYALWATTGETEISTWRGWALPWNPPPTPRLLHQHVWTPTQGGITVLAMYHEAFLYRAPWEKPTAMRDWTKVGQVLAGTWPEPFPQVIRHAPPQWPQRAAFDTEFNPETGRLLRYSLAWRFAGAPLVYVVNGSRAPTPPSTPPTLIVHNAFADLPYFKKLLSGRIFPQVEDTLVLHHTLWSDLEHTLDYVGSLYARTNAWKHLEDTNPTEYSAGDALGTWDSWDALNQELEREPRLASVYRRRLGLIPHILRSQERGSRVNHARAAEVLALLEGTKAEQSLVAQAAAGWPLNLGSPAQVAHQLYNVEGVHPWRGR